MLIHPATDQLGVPAAVLDLLLDPTAPRPARDALAGMLDDQLRQLIQGQPMLTLRLGRVLDEMTRKYERLGYVRLSDYGLEELGIGDRAIRNHARMKELLGRPVLLEAFLAGRLSMSHVLLLLRLPKEEDADLVARVGDLPVTKLRALLKERLPAEEASGQEEMGAVEFELEPEAYVDWLFTKEAACRRNGSDLPAYAIAERVLAEYVAAAALPEQEAAPFLLPPDQPAAVGREQGASDAREQGSGAQAPARPEHAPDCACCHASASDLPRELTGLLPHDARRLAVMARELMQAREASELLQQLILRRLQEQQLYRHLGFRGFRDYCRARGLAASTVYGHTARNRLLDAHPLIQRAHLEGRLTRSKVDVLLPLAGFCHLETWIEYGESRTWRLFRKAVETALAMKAKSPAAWARRGKRPPQDGESLEDLRLRAGLPTLEAAVDELQHLLGGGGVQTSSSTGAASGASGVQTSSSTEAAAGTSDAQTQPAGLDQPPKIRLRVPYPRSMDPLWKAAHAAACRTAGRELTREEALHRYMLWFLVSEDEPDPAARGDRLKALQGAGWQCEVPGCRSRCNLHVHHLVYRSHGGRDELPNYVVLCSAHHLRHVHAGRMTVEGEEPATRLWDVGIEDGVPYRTYVDDRLVDAWEWNREEEMPERVHEAVVPYRVDVLPRAA